MYKYINIQYEIFLTEFFYNKMTLFYIKKYIFFKNSINSIINRNNRIKFD